MPEAGLLNLHHGNADGIDPRRFLMMKVDRGHIQTETINFGPNWFEELKGLVRGNCHLRIATLPKIGLRSSGAFYSASCQKGRFPYLKEVPMSTA